MEGVWQPFSRKAIILVRSVRNTCRTGGLMLKEGDKAPDFAVKDDHGNVQRLNDYAGKKTVILFFYPKADTPG
jgi:peroxiredoxin